jgi:hypothetical protein
MNDEIWVKLLDLCNEILGEGSHSLLHSVNWCSWTTFERMNSDAQYWASGLPKAGEYGSTGIGDGGNWGQPFKYSSIAHLIIPRRFEFCGIFEENFLHKITEQDIEKLSGLLLLHNIKHTLSEWALEIRLIDNRL